MTLSFATPEVGAGGVSPRIGASAPKQYFGKYRGKVAENIDPLFLGRIIPIVPAVSEIPLTWAMPCTPYAGFQVGFYAIPPISANVWIEFEAGDPNYPIWTGCFWEEGQVPEVALPPGTTVFKTECITLIMRDIPGAGGLTLEITPPAVELPISINMDSAGIQVTIENLFTLTSEETNITSTTMTVETEETNITSTSLTIETEETNIASTAVTIEAEETNIAGAALTIETEETNIAGASLTVESGEMNVASGVFSVESGESNITSAALTIETVETNIASPAITIEGLVEVTGDLLIDGQQPIVI